MKRYSISLAFLTLSAAFLSLGVALGQEGQGNKKAFIAYVRDYIYVEPLEGVDNDAKELADVISKLYGHATCTIFGNSKPDKNDDPNTAPRDSFEREFNNWLESLTEDDLAVAYLSGHGVLDDEGKVHFAMQNIRCDATGRPTNLDEASYPMEVFRDKLNACKASKKLLILDCCHSGAMEEQEDDADEIVPQTATASQLNKVFKEATTVTTFASSRGDEYSLMMKDREHSLFTFWLAYGLRGFADDNFDGTVTLDELFNFVDKHVKAYVATNKTRPQSPQIINKNDVSFVVDMPYAGERKKQIAELLAFEIKNRNRNLKLGVPTFSYGADEYTIDRNGAIFPEKFAQGVAAEYENLARTESPQLAYIPFPVVKNRLEEKDLCDYKAFKADADEDVEENVALVRGNIKRSDKNVITLKVHCVDLDKDSEAFADIHCLALLRVGDYPDLGDSMTASQVPSVEEAKNNLRNAETEEEREEAERTLELANDVEEEEQTYIAAETARIREEEGREPNGIEKEEIATTAHENAVVAVSMREPNEIEIVGHPLEKENSYCKVSFAIRPYRKEGYPKGDNKYVEMRDVVFSQTKATLPLKENEEYAIHLENVSDEKLVVSVLVDGRDTLFHTSEGEGENGLLGPRRDVVEDNGLWYVPPKTHFNLMGFTDRDRKVYGAFHIEDFDLDSDVTGLTKYKDQIGVITICIWRCNTSRAGVTLPGKPTPIKLKETKVERLNYVGQYTIFYDKKD